MKISVLFFVSAVFTATCFAAMPWTAQWQTREDFMEGEIHDVRIGAHGEISLAGTFRETADFPDDASVWCIARDGKKRVVIGTGDMGRIYTLTREGSPHILLDSPEMAILTLLATGGKLYAGTSPDGLVYAIDQKGDTRVFFNSHQRYVWSITPAPGGGLVIGTGESGRLIILDTNGNEKKQFDLGADHVRCIAVTGTDIWCGTASPAAVYRIHGDDVQQVFQAKEKEINRMISVENTLYFTAVNGASMTQSSPDASGSASPVESKNADTVYRISDGIVEKWWSTNKTPITDILAWHDNVFVSCGDAGYMFKIIARNTAVLEGSLQDVPVATMAVVNDMLYLGTFSPAKLYSLTSQTAGEGRFISDVLDAGRTARWGTLQYDAIVKKGGAVSFETRSGNAREPDEFWSEWTPLDGDFHVQSPPAQFLQWKATLKRPHGGASPELLAVQISVRNPNLAPEIKEVTVYPVTRGVLTSQPGSSGKMYRQKFADGTIVTYSIRNSELAQGLPKGRWFKLRGMRTMKWTAMDPDRDRLRFKIEIAPFPGNAWILLEKDYKKPIYSFDSTAFPDGVYAIRITATDAPSNPAGQEQIHAMISRRFHIDNTPPTLENVKARRTGAPDNHVVISGTARDGESSVKKLEYSLDTEKWFVFTGIDGILDSASERFEVKLTCEDCLGYVWLRVTDEQENVTVKQVEIASKPEN